MTNAQAALLAAASIRQTAVKDNTAETLKVAAAYEQWLEDRDGSDVSAELRPVAHPTAELVWLDHPALGKPQPGDRVRYQIGSEVFEFEVDYSESDGRQTTLHLKATR